MKYLITIVFILCVQLGFSQLTIKKSSIDSGGEVVSNGDITMIYTVGEVVVQENSTGNIQISEGFINPDILSQIGVGIGTFEELTGVTVYPNPTVRYVNVEFVKNRQVRVMLYNEDGRILIQEKGDRFKLDLNSVASGLYFLIIKDDEHQKYKSFKIIKR